MPCSGFLQKKSKTRSEDDAGISTGCVTVIIDDLPIFLRGTVFAKAELALDRDRLMVAWGMQGIERSATMVNS